FERREPGQNTREHLRRRIMAARYTRMMRPDIPPGLEAVLARTMSRDPDARPPSALVVAEQFQAVQAELGTTVTPIEVAVDEWMPQRGVDFTDASLRSAVRAAVPYESARKTAA